MHTHSIRSQRGQSESEHSARPNMHTHVNCRPEFKCKHLLSVIPKDTDMRVFQTDKSRAARRTASGERRRVSRGARSAGTRWAPTRRICAAWAVGEQTELTQTALEELRPVAGIRV